MLAAEEMPKYKLSNKGLYGLTDIELVAQIISSSNTPGEMSKAVDKARNLLLSTHLRDLAKMTIANMIRQGLTETEALRLVTALELGRRKEMSDVADRPRISSSRDAFNAMSHIADLIHEEFWILILNKANEVIYRYRLSTGGTAGTVVDIKLVFKTVIEKNGTAFIASHNHPSGNLQPSQADIDLTRRLKKAGETMDIPILDHLIISERGYYSFADEGMM